MPNYRSLSLLWILLYSLSVGSVVSASQILFVNYNSTQTNTTKVNATNLGLTHSTISSLDGQNGAALAAAHNCMYIAPGDTSNFFTNLIANQSVLVSYLNAGGYLILNVATNLGDQANFVPGGVTLNNSGPNRDISVVPTDATHPYLTGSFDVRAKSLTLSELSGWNSTETGYLSNLPSGATTVLIGNDGKASWVEYNYGLGHVVVTNMTYGWGIGGGRGNPQDNLLLYGVNRVNASVPEPTVAMTFIVGMGIAILGRIHSRRKTSGFFAKAILP